MPTDQEVTAELEGGRRRLRRLRGAPANAVVLHVAEVGGQLVTPPDDLSLPGAHELLLAAHGLWEIFYRVTQRGTTVAYTHHLPDPRDSRFFPFDQNRGLQEVSWLHLGASDDSFTFLPLEYGVSS